MSRVQARELAMQIVYSQIFNLPYNQDSLLAPYENVYGNELDDSVFADKGFKKDKQYVDEVIEGVKNNLHKIDSVISKNLISWTIDKISKVDLAILRLAVYEIMYCDKEYVSVYISEAVNNAVKYSVPSSVKFINGILATISKIEEVKDK